MYQKLGNDCTLSKITVTPRNWKSPKANLNMQWEISYRFKDGNLKRTFQKRHWIPAELTTYQQRKNYIEKVIRSIDEKIVDQGFNPITKKTTPKVAPDFIAAQKVANNTMNIVDALEYAFKKLNCVRQYQDNVKYMKNYFITITKKQNMDQVLAKDFDEQYIKYILEESGKQKRLDRIEYEKKGTGQKIVGEPWNNNRYNYWRALLNSLMIILEDDKIIPRVFTKGVKQLKKTENKRRVIDENERKVLNKAYKDGLIPYETWRYIVVFYQTFRRHAEFRRIKREHIKLEKQKVEIHQLKGRNYKWVDATIIDDALPFWKELYEQAKPGQYIFSKGLKPGDTEVNPKQFSRLWNRLMKKKLGIEADSYTLKHWALDELAAKLELEAAQKAAGHSSAKVTRLYAQTEDERQHNRLKKVKFDF
jgi:hypothetical protein